MAIRILVVDNHRLFREGLCSLLDGDPRLEVVGQAGTGHEGVRLARELRPDVVVMDVGLRDLNGIEAARQIRRQAPRARVIFLSAHSDTQHVTRALETNAAGYLLKDSAFNEVLQAIQTALEGKIYLHPALAGKLTAACRAQAHGQGSSEMSALTPRQREVLQLVAEGWTTKQIASHLHVSTKTVETHRYQVMDKLDIHSVAELTKFAIRQGLTELEE